MGIVLLTCVILILEYGWRPIFVDNEIVINGPFGDDFIWQFEAQENHILAFSILDGNIKDAQQFLSVRL